MYFFFILPMYAFGIYWKPCLGNAQNFVNNQMIIFCTWFQFWNAALGVFRILYVSIIVYNLSIHISFLYSKISATCSKLFIFS